MAKNDITGDEIKSKGYSSKGRDNHDKIFAKRTFSEWRAIEGGPTMIVDNPKEEISYLEFKKMLKFKSLDAN